MTTAKPFEISWAIVREAFKRVKANRGSEGIDEQSIEAFEADLEDNLYKIWNRMSSGSYFPPPVLQVEIPKKSGGTRALGIPTVADRVAQCVAKLYLEPVVEPKFHEDSYGYRPGRQANDAVAVARQRCFERSWVVDLDIKGFFDNIPHDLVMKALRFHTDLRWLHLYVERWLKAPVQLPDGTLQERTKGSPQGGVISPLLANLFMHHAFDDWMARDYPRIPFERYADDAIVHCVSEKQAFFILQKIRKRMRECGLELHPEKTKVVYCKNSNRPGDHKNIAFDFLSYTFRPRRAVNRHGTVFTAFLPAVSAKAATAFRAKLREYRFPRWTSQALADLAAILNPIVRGWAHPFLKFYGSVCRLHLQYVNQVLMRWACRKYKRFRRRPGRAWRWLRKVYRRSPELFAHWKLGVEPNGWAGRAG